MTPVPARTPSEVAAALRVDRSSVTRALAANADESGQRSHLVVRGEHVPAFRFGRHWRIAGAPFDAAVAGQAVGAPSSEPTPHPPSRCADCSAGQHHGCAVWGGACGCGRSIDEVWSDIEAWARRMGRLR